MSSTNTAASDDGDDNDDADLSYRWEVGGSRIEMQDGMGREPRCGDRTAYASVNARTLEAAICALSGRRLSHASTHSSLAVWC